MRASHDERAPPSLPDLGFLDGGEQSHVYWRKIASLIMDNQVLRERPLGRFHFLGGARAPSSAIHLSVVGVRREVWPKRDSRRAFSVVLAKGC